MNKNDETIEKLKNMKIEKPDISHLLDPAYEREINRIEKNQKIGKER